MQAYCVKCRQMRQMSGATQVRMRNGRKAMRGKCPVCGTGLYRIMGK